MVAQKLGDVRGLIALLSPTDECVRLVSRTAGSLGRCPRVAPSCLLPRAGGIEAVVGAMRAHGGVAEVQQLCCMTSFKLGYESPSNQQAMKTAGDAVIILLKNDEFCDRRSVCN